MQARYQISCHQPSTKFLATLSTSMSRYESDLLNLILKQSVFHPFIGQPIGRLSTLFIPTSSVCGAVQIVFEPCLDPANQ
jgi:hypothetical protein